jgi:hypothetical protein
MLSGGSRSFSFLHIPFTSLIKILTRLRPRPLARANSAPGLRRPALAQRTRKRWVQAVHRVRPSGRFLRPALALCTRERWVQEAKTGAQNFYRAVPGTCEVRVKPSLLDPLSYHLAGNRETGIKDPMQKFQATEPVARARCSCTCERCFGSKRFLRPTRRSCFASP